MSFLAFLAAAVVLAITPGPGMAYVVARTVAGGRAEGLASCLGTALGGLLHVLAAALGLSLIVAQSALAFGVVKAVASIRSAARRATRASCSGESRSSRSSKVASERPWARAARCQAAASARSGGTVRPNW